MATLTKKSSGSLPPRIVTTSWDDGDIRDLRIRDLLLDKGLRGTFYCPVEPYLGRPALTKAHLREFVAQGLEVGGHGIAHEIMSEVPVAKIDGIVTECKAYLEDATGERVRMFCYPRGRFTTKVVEAVRGAGYIGARTVRMFATETGTDPFEMPTTIQACPHTTVQYLRNLARGRRLGRAVDYGMRLGFDSDWFALAKTLFDRVLANGGIWHLWGHSWEIDELGLWPQLAEMLDYVAGHDGVVYTNNGEVAESLAALIG